MNNEARIIMVDSIYRVCRYYQIQKQLGRELQPKEFCDYKIIIDKEIDQWFLNWYDEMEKNNPKMIEGIDKASLMRENNPKYPNLDYEFRVVYTPVAQYVLWQLFEIQTNRGKPLETFELYNFAMDIHVKLARVDLSPWKLSMNFDMLDDTFEATYVREKLRKRRFS